MKHIIKTETSIKEVCKKMVTREETFQNVLKMTEKENQKRHRRII